MNGIMNNIVSSDGEYQSIIRGSDVYSSGRLKQMKLPEEVRLLIVLRPQGFVNKYCRVFRTFFGMQRQTEVHKS